MFVAEPLKRIKTKIWRIGIRIFWRFRCRIQVLYEHEHFLLSRYFCTMFSQLQYNSFTIETQGIKRQKNQLITLVILQNIFKKLSNERIYCELPEGEPTVFPIPLDEILRHMVELDRGAPFHIPG